MSIIDNMTELRARLAEIEAEKAAGIAGEYGALSPEIYEGLKETIPPPAPASVISPRGPWHLPNSLFRLADQHPEDAYPRLCYDGPTALSRLESLQPGLANLVHMPWHLVQLENPEPHPLSISGEIEEWRRGAMVHDGWPPVQPENPDPVFILNEIGNIGRLEALRPEPIACLQLQSKVEMLRSQIRLYMRLHAECMQALIDTEARLATLKGKE